MSFFLVTSSVALEPDWPQSTVEARLNEVPMDWGNLFVISNTSISRIFEKTTKMFVVSRYTMITLQNPAFPDLNNCLST